MTDQWKREAKEMFLAAKNPRVPENLSVLASDAVAKSRAAFDQFQSVSKHSTRSLETVLQIAQDGARTIGETVLSNIERNTELAFDAAEAMARAKTIPEVLNLQSSFLQQQMSVSASQSRELLELSAKVTQQTLELMSAVALKNLPAPRALVTPGDVQNRARTKR
jgi:hypothetical protein